MNNHNKIPMQHKSFNYAVLIMIFLLNACASQYSTVNHEANDRVAASSYGLAGLYAGNCSSCSVEMREDNAMPAESQSNFTGALNEAPPQSTPKKGSRRGAKIVLLLHNQSEIAGRLLSVRDSALVISIDRLRENEVREKSQTAIVIMNQDIRIAIVKGESKVLKSAGVGFLVGAGIGVALGFITGDDRPCEQSYSEGYNLIPSCISMSAETKAALGGMVFGAIGLTAGFVSGRKASTSDEIHHPSKNYDFYFLKRYAQFPKGEPEYLDAVK